jgi:hypothetical protein
MSPENAKAQTDRIYKKLKELETVRHATACFFI